MHKIILCILCIILAGCNIQDKKAIQDKMQQITPVSTPYTPSDKQVQVPESWKQSVSLMIGANSSIKSLVQQLASTCDIKVNMDAIEDKIGITYSASNVSFLNILKDICRLVNWKIIINDRGDITVLDDTPYYYTHEVAFLVNADDSKYKRTDFNQDHFNKDHDLCIKQEVEIDLWQEIEDNIHFLLYNSNIIRNNIIDNIDMVNNTNDNHTYHTKHKQYVTKPTIQTKYSINKQAGVLIVYGTQAQHEKIAHFLQDLHMRIASQVFIEVHILSVEIGMDKQNGIDLSIENFFEPSLNDGLIAKNITEAIHFVHNCGPTTIIHSPRAMTRNNVPAIFQSVREDVYYKITKSYSNLNTVGRNKTTSTPADHTFAEYTSEPKIIKSGIILTIRPMIIDFINRITALRIKANLSSSDHKVKDPIVNISGGSDSSEYPILDRKYIETTITLKHGEVAIIGGLMEDKERPASFGFNGTSIKLKAHSYFGKQILFLVSCKVQPMDHNKYGNNKLSQYEIMEFSA